MKKTGIYIDKVIRFRMIINTKKKSYPHIIHIMWIDLCKVDKLFL